MSHGTLRKPDRGILPKTLKQRLYTFRQGGNTPKMLPVSLRDRKTLSRRAVSACSGPGNCLYTPAWEHTSSSQDVSLIPGTGLAGWVIHKCPLGGFGGTRLRPRMDNPGITECRLSGNSHEENDIGEIEGGGEGICPFS